MLISPKHSFVFFCTPKCASNSVEAMLKPYAQLQLLGSPAVRHTNVQTFDEHLAPYLASVAPETRFTRVAIVRDPVDWLYSWYRFRSRAELRGGASANSTEGVSFAEFVDCYLDVDSRPAFADVGSQAEFLAMQDGSIGVDRLFAFDELEALVEFFSDRVGKPLALTALNVSPSKAYQNRAVEQVMSIMRGVKSRIGLGPAASRPKPKVEAAEFITGDSLAELKKLLAGDYRFYEMSKRP